MLPTEDELRERYATYSSKRLLSIVHHKDQYTPQALETARAELASRDITAADVDVFLDEEEQRQLTAKMLSCVPLNFWERVLFFFAWFASWFIIGAFRLNYSEDGYALKLKQSVVFSVAGFISLLLTGVIGVYLNLSYVASGALLIVFFFLFGWVEKNVVYDLRQ